MRLVRYYLVWIIAAFLSMEGAVRLFNLDGASGVVISAQSGRSSDPVKFEKLKASLGSFGYAIGTHASDLIFRKGKLVQEAYYTIGGCGNRRVPAFVANRPAIAFLGGSYTFGQFVDDISSFPAQLQVLAPEYSIINFGITAQGPHQTLPWLVDFKPFECGGQKPKAIVYTWIDDYIASIVGSSHYLGWHPLDGTPLWKMTGSRLTRKPHTLSLRLRKHWGRGVKSLRLSNLINFEWPRDVYTNTKHWDLAAELIRNMEQATHELGAHFTVILFPGSVLGHKWLLPRLRQLGIPVLDYSKPYMRPADYWIPFDLHPNELAYREVAHALARDLPKLLESMGVLHGQGVS